MLQESQINQSVLNRFSILAKAQRLAHAYLFIGPMNIGKGETALAVAKLIHCGTEKDGLSCEDCPACAKINAGAHPDVLIIDHEPGESIKIEQIRALLDRMKLRPWGGTKKVVLIRNIEQLTPEAANAFLKTLEEPSASTLILLTTSVPEQNPETIRSRCQAVYFQPLSNSELEERLRGDHRLKENDAHFLAYFAQGCPGAVQRMMDSDILRYKDEVIDGFLFRRPAAEEIKAVVDDKEQAKVFLNILFSWIRDVLLLKSGVDDRRLIHRDRREALERFALKYSFEELSDLNRSVVHMYELLAENLNIKLPLMIIGEQIWRK
jgi:DNA polymerase-3 subunit delta'